MYINTFLIDIYTTKEKKILKIIHELTDFSSCEMSFIFPCYAILRHVGVNTAAREKELVLRLCSEGRARSSSVCRELLYSVALWHGDQAALYRAITANRAAANEQPLPDPLGQSR